MSIILAVLVLFVLFFEESNCQAVKLVGLYRYYNPARTNHITQPVSTWRNPGFNYPGTFLGYAFSSNIPGTRQIWRFYHAQAVDHMTSSTNPGPGWYGQTSLGFIATGPNSVSEDILRELGCKLTLTPLNRYYVAATTNHFDVAGNYGGQYNQKTTLGYVCTLADPAEYPTLEPTKEPAVDECVGCSADGLANGDSCYKLTPNSDNIFACRGTFENGMNNEAESICNQGYHICESAIEARNLGLTYPQCSSVGNNEMYFSKESSMGSWNCNSEHNTNGVNDIWGCGGNDGMRKSIFDRKCKQNTKQECYNTFNTACSSVLGDYYDNGRLILDLDVNPNDELNNIALKDKNYGGVLCCKD